MGNLFSEPIGSTKPKFPTIIDSLGFRGEQLRALTLLCPAQGYPLPSFRYAQVLYLVVEAYIEIVSRTHRKYKTKVPNQLRKLQLSW